MREKRRRGEPVQPHESVPSQEGARLSWDGAPHSCGGSFSRARGPQPVDIRGATVMVDADHYYCAECGEVRFDLDQLDRARRAAMESLAESEGLLRPDEIRGLREKLGLTQAEFETALGLGPKTMVRWETARVMPCRAMALLLLLIRRDPSAMGFLIAHTDGKEVVEKVVCIRVQEQPQWQLALQTDLLRVGLTGEFPAVAA